MADQEKTTNKEKRFEDVDLEDSNSKEGVALLSENDRKQEETSSTKQQKKGSTFDSATFISRYITLWWMNDLFSNGSKRPLEEEDISSPPKQLCTQMVCDQLERCWERELYDDKGNVNENPSLVKAVAKAFGVKYALYGILPFLIEALKIAQPIFLGFLVRYFSPKTEITKTEAFIYALSLTLCSVGTTVLMTPYNILRQRTGMAVRVAVTSLVYKKVLKLSNAALAKTTSGHIVNLISTDTQRLDLAFMFLHYLVLGPLVLLVSAYLLWREISWSCLSGVGLLLLLIPVQMAMGRILMRFRRKTVLFTDERIKVMNEIIAGARVIKLYSWENSFKEVVSKIRWEELKAILKLNYMRAAFLSFFFSSVTLVYFVTFVTYVVTGNYLTAQKVFTCVALLNSARVVLTMYFPIGVVLFNEGRVGLERLQKLLLLEDIKKPNAQISGLRPKPTHCNIQLTDVSARWTEDVQTLSKINLQAKMPDLVAVVGTVASGKSSLLMTILGELPPESGEIEVKGKIAYASQQPWVFNGTLKYNITLGEEYDEEKYNTVIKVCALQKDLEQLPDGDMTLVGERGVALSGGQKARVNLARAVYTDADIYILDDPFSAVDAHVGRILFEQCINGYLSKKLRILVTHQLQYLRDADNILVLDEGDIAASGTFDELSQRGIDFLSLLNDEEKSESGIELDKVNSDEALERRFSKQQSCYLRSPSKVTSRRMLVRPTSVEKYEVSLRDSQVMQSELALTHDTKAVEVFEEQDVPKENKATGAIGVRTYLKLYKAGFGLVVWTIVILMFFLSQAVYLVADWWLSYWCNKEQQFLYSNRTMHDTKALNRTTNVSVYSGLVIAVLFFGISKSFLFFRVMNKSSEGLHAKMFSAVLRAPIYFFDTVSIGRILNRFSKDLSLVDDILSLTMFDMLQTGLVVIGILILVAANNPLVFAVVVPLVVIFTLLRRYYIRTARDVKRIEGVARSPVFGHFSTTLLGLPTIRAFEAQNVFTDLFYKCQDAHSGAWYSFIGCANWLGFRLDLLCIAFIGAVAFISVAVAGQLNPGTIGLILSYTIGITAVSQQCVKQSTEVENQMTSVERILEYCDMEPEVATRTDHKPPEGWPSRGSVMFENMSFKYHPTLPNVLHDISCHIHANEKIGVCGRTGAGKSSLLSTLFRTAEPLGIITIDGENILEMDIYDLRSKLSIIPQDPVLFSGTMRYNLDPFSDYSDIEVWKALEEVQLKDAILALPGKLESEMAESGNNLSVGQRQLVCLARAILRNNKILVIDEATANVDPITDSLIQSTIREQFKHCTVLTIAHRLNTIMDSDRIMVLDAGRLKEIGEPYKLLRCKNSLFYHLVSQTGPTEAQKLFSIARKTYFDKLKEKAPAVMSPTEEMGMLDDIEDEINSVPVSPFKDSVPILNVVGEEGTDFKGSEIIFGAHEDAEKAHPVESKEIEIHSEENVALAYHENKVNEFPQAGSEEEDEATKLILETDDALVDSDDPSIDVNIEQPIMVKMKPDPSSAEKDTLT